MKCSNFGIRRPDNEAPNMLINPPVYDYVDYDWSLLWTSDSGHLPEWTILCFCIKKIREYPQSMWWAFWNVENYVGLHQAFAGSGRVDLVPRTTISNTTVQGNIQRKNEVMKKEEVSQKTHAKELSLSMSITLLLKLLWILLCRVHCFLPLPPFRYDHELLECKK